MHKMLAALAIIWILTTVYFTFAAVKGDYPIWFGVATSTLSVSLGALVGFLLIVVLK